MKERERKERGEIRMKQKVDKMDERDMEEEGKNRKRKRGFIFLELLFLCFNQESERPEGK
jgi:hypothetical protein